jgi:hypothetical protein
MRGQKPVTQYTVQDVEEWKYQYLAKTENPGGVNLNYRSLKALFYYCYKILRVVPENIFTRT